MAHLPFAVEQIGDVTILKFTRPDFDDDPVVEAVGTALSRLIEEEGPCRFILDLENVRRVSSSMLGKLIALHKKVRQTGGQILLCGLVPDLAEKFEITNLTKILRICPTRQDALAALQGQ